MVEEQVVSLFLRKREQKREEKKEKEEGRKREEGKEQKKGKEEGGGDQLKNIFDFHKNHL